MGGHHLCNELGKWHLYATYWPNVHDIFDTVFFRNQGYVGVVDPIKA
jgi:hypothetical protein